MPNASELIEREEYTDGSGTKRLTRVDGNTVEWQISARNGKIYMIKFEKNFVKKHLYTSTEKDDKVQQEAKRLWDALPDKDRSAWWWQGWWISYPTVLVDQAKKTLDEQKFKKQLAHRSKAEGDVCKCGHAEDKHKTQTGASCSCKGLTTSGPCTCSAYVRTNAYENKRTAQSKPTANPLAGARTEVNTVLLLNKLTTAKLKEVLSDAIIAQENKCAMVGPAWGAGKVGMNADCETIELDFGASSKGCVLKVEAGKDYDHWSTYQGIKVTVKNLKSSDPKKPSYAIVHMEDTI